MSELNYLINFLGRNIGALILPRIIPITNTNFGKHKTHCRIIKLTSKLLTVASVTVASVTVASVTVASVTSPKVGMPNRYILRLIL